MSISSTNRKAGPFNGNGAQTSFPFTFKVFLASDLYVVLTDANGAETVQTLTSQYTVSLNANQDTNPGGNVIMITAPPTGYMLTLGSQVPQTQGLQIGSLGNFDPSAINGALDRLTILAQQLAEQVGRAVKTTFSSTTSPDQLVSQLLTASSTAQTAASAAAASATAASKGIANVLTNVTGTNTITATCSTVTAYSANQIYAFEPVNNNTGPVTVNVGSLGALNAVKQGSIALDPGDLVTGKGAMMLYDGVQLQLLNPAAGDKAAGTDKQVQFNDGTVRAGATMTWDKTTNTLTVPGAIKVQSGTVATSAPLRDDSQTWNDGTGLVVFTGWRLNVTDTSSASGSLLFDLQVAGSSKFNVSKAGVVVAGGSQLVSQKTTGTDGTLMFRNRLRNGNFTVNLRAVSGTVTLAAGAYGHDGWKAGASGCTYTFATSGNSTVITISAGSLLQIVEAGLIEGGTYALSNQGTAQARIAVNGAATSGAYASATTAAPLLSASATANQQVTVEFTTGTIDRALLEPGTLATAFERRPRAVELAINQLYYRNSYSDGVAPGTAATNGSHQTTAATPFILSCGSVRFGNRMRAIPAVTIYSPNSGATANMAEYNTGGTFVADRGSSTLNISTDGFEIQASGAATAGNNERFHWAASAEL